MIPEVKTIIMMILAAYVWRDTQDTEMYRETYIIQIYIEGHSGYRDA